MRLEFHRISTWLNSASSALCWIPGASGVSERLVSERFVRASLRRSDGIKRDQLGVFGIPRCDEATKELLYNP